MCERIPLSTTVVHNTAQNSSHNFPFILQTIIIAQMMSAGGARESEPEIINFLSCYKDASEETTSLFVRAVA